MNKLMGVSIGMTLVLGVSAATCVPAAPASQVSGSGQGTLRSWTPTDSVHVRYFSVLHLYGGWSKTNEGEFSSVSVSSDGKYFFALSQHGDVDCDCNQNQISVYASEDVRRALRESSRGAPSPVRTITTRHQSEGIPIAGWVGGKHVIEFVARKDLGSSKQAYRFDVESGELETLTAVSSDESVGSYWSEGSSAIYHVQTRVVAPARYPIYAVTAELMKTSVAEADERPLSTSSYVSYDQRTPWKLRSGYLSPALYLRSSHPWFTADGRRAVMLRAPQAVSSSWAGYRGQKAAPTVDTVGQYMLIDLERGEEFAPFDAPWGKAVEAGSQVEPQALWSADGRKVVLVNTALPLEGKGSSAEYAGMSYIVSYDVDGRSWEVLEPLRDASGVTVKDVSWTEPGKSFLVRHEKDRKAVAGTLYEWRDGQWRGRATGAAVVAPPAKEAAIAGGISVELRQSMNDPPVLVASRGGKEVVLTPPDPALEGVWVARTEPFQWKDGEGATRTAGLTLPRQLPGEGQKIPLVIQVYTYEPHLFRPNGPFSTAFATQSLAAQGMAVLTVDSPTSVPGARGTPRELSLFIDWMETATAALAREHRIDADRVGVIGFSRTGYQLRYAITNPGKQHLATAIIADSATGSYQTYLIYQAINQGYMTRSYENAYGGPFYQSKSSWLDKEVSFNVDRVQTPVLFVDNVIRPAAIIDTIGAFKLNRKPFDYLAVASKYHDIQEVQPLVASQEATVDWMRFWLQGVEDPRPDKAERYARWREQRVLYEKQRAAGTPAAVSSR